MRHFLLFLFFLPQLLATAQGEIPSITFEAHQRQNLPFNYVPNSPWESKHPWVLNKKQKKKYLPVKVLAEGETDWVKVVCSDSNGTDWNLIDFYFGKKLLIPRIVSPYEAELRIDNPGGAEEIGAYFNDIPLAQIRTILCAPLTRKVIVIPLTAKPLNRTILQNELNAVYRQANILVNLEIRAPFSTKVFNDTTVFGPSDSTIYRYTGQMRLLRDQYFEKNPKIDKKAFYIFLIPSFTDSSKIGFMLPMKSLGFLPIQPNLKKLALQMARTLAVGMGGLADSWTDGPPIGTTKNLMDTTNEKQLKFFQIEKLQNPNFYFSMRDAYEFIRTGNGTVAYYFWNENENGEIVWNGKSPLSALKRPFKRNFLAYRFNLESPLLRPLFRMGKYYVSLLNFVLITLLIVAIYIVRKIIKKYWDERAYPRFFRRLFFWIKLSFAAWLIYLSFGWGNLLLDRFALLNGPLPEFNGKNYLETKKLIFSNADFRKKSEYGMRSEALIQKGENWRFKSPKQVLYFDLKYNEQGQQIMRYKTSSEKLILRAETYLEKAQNHYVVFNYYQKNDSLEKQEVFSYDGKKIENILEQSNPPRRVLLFVNGYRPTSTGKTFGENFKGIQTAGFEYPNSTNHIYAFDRYEYWEPWGEINLKFQNKINPSVTYYADGHFSVRTSNYRSLLNFSRISQAYPKRCENPEKHVCRTVKTNHFLRFLIPTSQTEKLIKLNANEDGFNYRKEKGRIAGMNLLQELNLYPDFSKNDTLYVVAHSMGYAYSLGIVSALRKKINFGGFYIIAPENAKSGQVKPAEWNEIWQYGSRFNLNNSDAPCLQDGVAPQTGVKNLPFTRRVFIPAELYTRKGFFDSHFIGYYDWILRLNDTEKGYIKQR